MEPPPPPPSREEAPAQAEKRPLDAADPAEVAAKKQRLADPSSPIDPKDVEGLKDNDRQEAIAAREAEAKAKIQAEAERRERERAEQAAAAEAARIQKQKEEAAARLGACLRSALSAKQVKCGDENKGRSRGLEFDSRAFGSMPRSRVIVWSRYIQRNAARRGVSRTLARSKPASN